MKNHCFLIFLSAAATASSIIAQGCEKITLGDYGHTSENAQPAPQQATDTSAVRPDTMIAVNDTARFYLSGQEYAGITLTLHPTPSAAIGDMRYRLPTKLEVCAVLRTCALPDDYWRSRQRILCYDAPKDSCARTTGTTFGTGLYYTYIPGGTVTKAGTKTKYCILPIRTERHPMANTSANITVNDDWKADQYFCTFP